MKLVVFICTMLMATTFSCKKFDDAVPAATTATIDVKAVMPTGNWTVGSLRQRAEDKSSNFKNINFAFSADGTVTTTDNNKTTKGTWVYSPVVTYYGGSGLASITISLGTAKPYDLLNGTWNLNSSSTSSNIQLDYKEPAEDEHLSFVKN